MLQVTQKIFPAIALMIKYLLIFSMIQNSATDAGIQNPNSIYLPLIMSVGNNGIQNDKARINLPQFDYWRNAAIAWFGQVSPTDNYTDIRLAFTDDALLIRLHTIDRRIWYDTTPEMADLTNWDAITLFLYTGQAPSSSLDKQSYKLVAQYNWWEDRAKYQASYRWNDAGWQLIPIQFNTSTGYQGDIPNNDIDDRGWFVIYELPYSSLGYSIRPNDGTVWRIAVTSHDRDDSSSPHSFTKNWPDSFTPDNPSTWNQIHFGLPSYIPPQAINLQEVMIRHKLNGATVYDAHVGGHTTCGDPFAPDYFTGWGNANYYAYSQVNIQNQGNIADWPCFSKYFVTFPLDQIPPGKIIVSADLVLHQFGNSNPSQAEPSLIQVFTIDEDWDERSITWNNAPQALENVSQARIDPLAEYPGVPGVARRWDISRAVSHAFLSGQSLRIALYSADMSLHSGKYFYSSDVDDYIPDARPALLVTYGDP